MGVLRFSTLAIDRKTQTIYAESTLGIFKVPTGHDLELDGFRFAQHYGVSRCRALAVDRKTPNIYAGLMMPQWRRVYKSSNVAQAGSNQRRAPKQRCPFSRHDPENTQVFTWNSPEV